MGKKEMDHLKQIQDQVNSEIDGEAEPMKFIQRFWELAGPYMRGEKICPVEPEEGKSHE